MGADRLAVQHALPQAWLARVLHASHKCTSLLPLPEVLSEPISGPRHPHITPVRLQSLTCMPSDLSVLTAASKCRLLTMMPWMHRWAHLRRPLVQQRYPQLRQHQHQRH